MGRLLLGRGHPHGAKGHTYLSVLQHGLRAVPAVEAGTLHSIEIIEPYFDAHRAAVRPFHEMVQACLQLRVSRIRLVTKPGVLQCDVVGPQLAAAQQRLRAAGVDLDLASQQEVHRRYWFLELATRAVCLDVEFGLHLHEPHGANVPQPLRICRKAVVEIFILHGRSAEAPPPVAVGGPDDGEQSGGWLRRKLHQVRRLERRVLCEGLVPNHAQQVLLVAAPRLLAAAGAAVRQHGPLEDPSGAEPPWECPNPLCGRWNAAASTRCTAASPTAACLAPRPDWGTAAQVRGRMWRDMSRACRVLQRWWRRRRRAQAMKRADVAWARVWDLKRAALRQGRDLAAARAEVAATHADLARAREHCHYLGGVIDDLGLLGGSAGHGAGADTSLSQQGLCFRCASADAVFRAASRWCHPDLPRAANWSPRFVCAGCGALGRGLWALDLRRCGAARRIGLWWRGQLVKQRCTEHAGRLLRDRPMAQAHRDAPPGQEQQQPEQPEQQQQPQQEQQYPEQQQQHQQQQEQQQQ